MTDADMHARVRAVDELVADVLQQVDRIDNYFMQHPINGRELSEAEAGHLIRRRQLGMIVRSTLDKLELIWNVADPEYGPRMFGFTDDDLFELGLKYRRDAQKAADEREGGPEAG